MPTWSINGTVLAWARTRQESSFANTDPMTGSDMALPKTRLDIWSDIGCKHISSGNPCTAPRSNPVTARSSVGCAPPPNRGCGGRGP